LGDGYAKCAAAEPREGTDATSNASEFRDRASAGRRHPGSGPVAHISVGADPDTDGRPKGNGHARVDGEPNCHPDADRDRSPNAHGQPHADADRDASSYADRHRRSHEHAHPDAEGHTGAHRDTDGQADSSSGRSADELRRSVHRAERSPRAAGRRND
jgi:hypothetical protein